MATLPPLGIDLLLPYEDEESYLTLLSFIMTIGMILICWAVFQYTVYIMYSRAKLTRLSASPFFVLGLALTSMIIECIILGANFNWIYEEFKAAQGKENDG